MATEAKLVNPISLLDMRLIVFLSKASAARLVAGVDFGYASFTELCPEEPNFPLAETLKSRKKGQR